MMSTHKMPRKSQTKTPSQRKPAKTGTYWLYGRHAVLSALQNEKRRIIRILMTENSASGISLTTDIRIEKVKPDVLEKYLPEGALHQGIAIETYPLANPVLDDCIASGQPLLLLDQVTDPHNIGAILRSAAAFNAGAVIVPQHHAPEETGVLAKTASGALEVVPLLRVPNLAQTIEYLKKNGYWCAGMDGEARQTLEQAKLGKKTALVMGAEGKGLRRLTAETCDLLVKLPMSEKMESLNVSNAAAIALYVLYTQT